MRSTWPPLLPARCRRSQSVGVGSHVVGAPPAGHGCFHSDAPHTSLRVGNPVSRNQTVPLFTEEATTSSLEATDGRTTALARSRAVRMAPQLHAAACTLLDLQPAQTHTGCEQPNTRQAQTAKCIFGATAGRSLVTPPFTSKTPPQGGTGSAAACCSGTGRPA